MRKLSNICIGQFLQSLATQEKVLNIGGGTHRYKDFFPNQVAIDIDPGRHPDVVGDAHNLPFEDQSFDAVLCAEVLEHLIDPMQAISEMRRVLKPGGRAIITTRFVFPVHDYPGDYYRFTPGVLKLLFADGWHTERLEAENDAFGALAVLLQRTIYQTKLRGGKITKGILELFARLLSRLDWLVVAKYGDIKRSEEIDIFLSSGVYGVFRKL